MNRVVLFVVLIVLFISSLLAGYLYIKTTKRPVTPSINAVPSDAALIFETDNLLADWKNQSANSLIFEELKNFENFNVYDSIIGSVDSLIKDVQGAGQIGKLPFLISLHQSGAKSFDLLLSFSLPVSADREVWLSEIENNLAKVFTTTEKTYDNCRVLSYSGESLSFFYAYHNDVVMLSKNQLIIEEAIRQLNSNKSLLNNKSFQTIYDTKGKGNQGNLLVNPGSLVKLLKPTSKVGIAGIENFGEWIALDVLLKPNAIYMNGFTYVSDSTAQFLNRFRKQVPQSLEISEYIPTNTAYLLQYGVSNFEDYHANFLEELDIENNLFEYERTLNNKKEIYGSELFEGLLAITQNELGVFIVEPILSSMNDNAYAFIKFSNVLEAESLLKEASIRIDSLDFEGEKLVIYQNQIGALLPTIYGKAFGIIENQFFVRLKSYLLFSNTANGLNELITQYKAGNTLSNDKGFQQIEDNLSSESNVLLYLNNARLSEVYKEVYQPKALAFYTDNKEQLKNFQSFTFQATYNSKNLFYTNSYVSYNSTYKQETGSLWEYELDSTLTIKPKLFVNHYTKAKEIIVQDAKNNLYLISNTGKLLWKKELDGQIQGKVYQVDAYKNRKFQILLNTANTMYLLDRKGRAVENFPVKIDKGITGGIELMDYDNNREYRILVPTNDLDLMNYKITGEKVKGWRYRKSNNALVTSIGFIKIKSKDYVILNHQDGSVSILNRRGEEREKFEAKLPSYGAKRTHVIQGSSFAKTYWITTDSIGNIVKTFPDGQVEIQTTDHVIDKDHAYRYFEHSNESFHLFSDQNSVYLYNGSMELLFEKEFEDGILIAPQPFEGSQGILNIALVLKNKNRLFLINQFGLSVENYPFKGATQVSVDDLNNDDNLNLIVGSSDGKVLMYSLQ